MATIEKRKALIAGDTGGIGAALKAHLVELGWEVIGLSRQNGNDLNHPESSIKAAQLAKGCQLVINSVPAVFGQVLFLNSCFEVLKDTDALILNIGSNNTDGIKNRPHLHSCSKIALEHLITQLQYSSSRCKVSLLKLGYVESPRAEKYDHQPKLPMRHVLDAFDFIINQRDDSHVREIYISHSNMELDR